MIKGERARVGVDFLDEEGAGVATVGADGGPSLLRVPFVLPGERALVEVEHASPHGRGAWGRLVELIAPSEERVKPACAAWGRCGGCVVQHWRHGSQLTWKRARLIEALGKQGIAPSSVDECVAGTRPLGYRNRSKLVFAKAGGRVILGAYAPGSHRVMDLAGCAVVEPPLDEAASALARIATNLEVSIHDQASGGGDLRYAILRVNWRGEVLVLLVVARPGVAGVLELARRLRAERPEVVGVVENLNRTRGNALIGTEEPDRVLDGAAALDEQIGPVRLRLSGRSFLQANREVAARLYADLARAAALTGSERAIDVYCGAGAIALTLARSAGEVLGVEESPAAVEDARVAAGLSGTSNARFIAGDAARVVSEIADAGGRADVVVLNPPRKGTGAPVIAATLRMAPRTVLYVSCSPDSLARDLRLLQQGGFSLASVTPYDMLPHTPHVEALAVLRR